MTIWWKIGIVAAIVALIFFGGDYVRGKFDQAAQLKTLQAELEAAKTKQKTLDDHAKQLETDLAAERENSRQISLKWSAYRAKNHVNCVLDGDAVSLLKAASGVAADHPAEPHQ